jgi:hypothetical protein
MLWNALRSNAIVLIRERADPDREPMGEHDR